jgi:hypothetical protein
LRGLILSAAELRELHPEWSEAMIEDYLNIFENIITLSEAIGNGMELVPGAGEGNIPVFDDAGQVEDSGESIDTLRARSYFYGRAY